MVESFMETVNIKNEFRLVLALMICLTAPGLLRRYGAYTISDVVSPVGENVLGGTAIFCQVSRAVHQHPFQTVEEHLNQEEDRSERRRYQRKKAASDGGFYQGTISSGDK